MSDSEQRNFYFFRALGIKRILNYFSDTMSQIEEYILSAAVYFDDKQKHTHQPKNIETGFVISGRRHHNCFMTACILDSEMKYKKFKQIQGFITNSDRFIDRKEACIVAKKAGQVKDEPSILLELFSEDLY